VYCGKKNNRKAYKILACFRGKKMIKKCKSNAIWEYESELGRACQRTREKSKIQNSYETKKLELKTGREVRNSNDLARRAGAGGVTC